MNRRRAHSDDPNEIDAVAPSSQADYTTRIVVNRPIDLNGTVVVEWLNVSGGADGSPAWIRASCSVTPSELSPTGRSNAPRRLMMGTPRTT